ncbi:MAG: tRNA epoxyqueuosine(34) reductase QueG [Kaiparowitsia implicata GSE-PSE-MK54-09C]|jgi:epoxyqueuosine reductase|nr:tRNA epoxyqueuosine(34) reductase QueG [Kaiparowitsia implicata GSE-PSE-MK54-09C]
MSHSHNDRSSRAPHESTLPTRDDIKHYARQLGFHKVGIAPVEPAASLDSEPQIPETSVPTSADSVESLVERDAGDRPDNTPPTEASQSKAALSRWLAQGYHAEMQWMERPQRQDIRQVMPEVRSLICVALNYYTPHQHSESGDRAKISRYGWGRDYHRVLHKRLKALTQWLTAQHPSIHARYYADTGPVQDKLWAERAGIGWIAKNSNLITRDYGSWVFLGEVLTNLELAPDRPHLPHCGTCTRCLDACPTQAIVEPFVVDANRCIAYHTIENRDPELPEAIAPQLQGWVAGCDICQDVCPWNVRFAQETDIAEFQPYPWHVNPPLHELATLSDEDWGDRTPTSALRRIKPAMIRRNARANLISQRE